VADMRDYTSIYNIKDFSINSIAPKYFDMESINKLNVGLLGYVTELASTMTEDTFNSVSTYVKEIFPNQAQIPETLYNYAANLQIEDLFATPARINAMIFVNENDIITKGTAKETQIEFVLDSDAIIDIEGVQFMLDYDVIISAREYASSYIYTAQYDIGFNNSLSDVSIPYIKTVKTNMSNGKWLGLMVELHQVNKFEQQEFIINNDKINLPTISVDFIDQLANFEVFYKPPGAVEYTQLKKRMFGSPPLREPFCYYRLKEEGNIELTFTMRDNYFQPEFNSEVLIQTYTTQGVKGNFPEYKGGNVTVAPKSDAYLYNNSIIVFAVPQGDSTNGKDRLTLEELRSKIIEKNSISGAYNIESDLQLYFSNYQYKDRNQVLFVKKRDDVLERIFAAFALFKDQQNNYYPTNTLNVDLYKDNFDLEYEQSNRFILKAGHVFKYDSDSSDQMKMIPGYTVRDDLSKLNEKFLYTNPFMITMQKNPSIVGFYLNSMNEKIPLEYSYVNSESVAQFICNNISVKRNALAGEDDYKLTVTLAPATELDQPLVNPTTKEFEDFRYKVAISIEESGSETCFINCNFVSFDEAANTYTFEATLTTDDYMTMGEKLSVFNVKNIDTGELEANKLIPMRDCVVNVLSFIKYDAMKVPHKYDSIDEFSAFTLTNIYSASTQKISFITPLDIMRTRVKYQPMQVEKDGVMVDDYYMAFSFVPLVGANALQDTSRFDDFISIMYGQYNYLLGAVNQVTNNYGIDLKFYNTFGRSKNFVVGEDGQVLDRTNIKIHIKVAPTIGAIEAVLIRDLKIFIKDYIEGINNKGYNAIYISNLIQAIENQFSEVLYMKFININEYDSSVQVIENRGVDLTLLTKEERRDYIPEYLTLGLDDITIDIIRS
jgi:hypothetical protein